MAEISAVKERGLRIRLEEDIRRMLLKNMTSMNVEAIVALKQPLLYDSSGINKTYILFILSYVICYATLCAIASNCSIHKTSNFSIIFY